ncbi:hypothetical protein GCM10009682_46980 [Luedemannella flava]|uniref:Uncharacterized protein n=1 Tax=Luedemannella flava TaxID=349316 RepID=A0ABP4YKF9_9ACTN
MADAPPDGMTWGLAGRWVVVVLASAIGLALAIGDLALPGFSGGDEPTSGSSPRPFACLAFGGADGTHYCERAAIEVGRRPAVTEEQRRRGMDISRKASDEIGFALLCAQGHGDCPPGAEAPTVEQTLEDIRQRFLRNGLTGTVRVAGPDDIGPPGTILYGVLVADACVVGYLKFPNGGGSSFMTGTLPDGGCLSSA